MKILVGHGCDLKVELGASKNKSTPLMLAAQGGHLQIVKFLISKTATVEARGKTRVIAF